MPKAPGALTASVALLWPSKSGAEASIAQIFAAHARRGAGVAEQGCLL